jgi:hypothetical protein
MPLLFCGESSIVPTQTNTNKHTHTHTHTHTSSKYNHTLIPLGGTLLYVVFPLTLISMLPLLLLLAASALCGSILPCNVLFLHGIFHAFVLSFCYLCSRLYSAIRRTNSQHTHTHTHTPPIVARDSYYSL